LSLIILQLPQTFLDLSAMTPEEIAYQQAQIAGDKGPEIVGAAIFFIVFPTVIVVLRFLARSLRKLPLGIDDYFTLPALVGVNTFTNHSHLPVTGRGDPTLCAEHPVYGPQFDYRRHS
jgi:hypothetical protein